MHLVEVSLQCKTQLTHNTQKKLGSNMVGFGASFVVGMNAFHNMHRLTFVKADTGHKRKQRTPRKPAALTGGVWLWDGAWARCSKPGARSSVEAPEEERWEKRWNASMRTNQHWLCKAASMQNGTNFVHDSELYSHTQRRRWEAWSQDMHYHNAQMLVDIKKT